MLYSGMIRSLRGVSRFDTGRVARREGALVRGLVRAVAERQHQPQAPDQRPSVCGLGSGIQRVRTTTSQKCAAVPNVAALQGRSMTTSKDSWMDEILAQNKKWANNKRGASPECPASRQMEVCLV